MLRHSLKYIAALSIPVTLAALNRRAGHTAAPWYIGLISIAITIGTPLTWRALYQERRWALKLGGRIVLAWMIIIPLASPLLGSNPFTAYVPGPPIENLFLVLVCSAIFGLMVTVITCAVAWTVRAIRMQSPAPSNER